MTSRSERIPLGEARWLAEDLRRRLCGACERIEIAGSIRRGKATVKDIELLAIPKRPMVPSGDLFNPELVPGPSALWALIDKAIVKPGSKLARHPSVNGRKTPWGDRYRKLVWCGVPVDLFTATETTWGSQFLIRTGPREMSQRYVSLLKREGFRHDGGLILNGDDQQIEVRTEREAFAIIGWRWRAPEQRWEREREVARV